MFYTDSPARDWENYQAYLEKQNIIFLSRCKTCFICNKPIDPNEDTHCLDFGDGYAHTACVSKKLKTSNLEDWLKDVAMEGIEEAYYANTPVPNSIF